MNSKFTYLALLFLAFSISAFSQSYNFDATLNGTTINTCNATLYDSGGPDGSYGNNEGTTSNPYVVTFCADDPTATLRVEVIALNTEATYDVLNFYDGTNRDAPLLLGPLSGTTRPDLIRSTGNCVTISWRSDGSATRAGYEIRIRCDFPCQDFTVGVIPDAEFAETLDGDVVNAYLGCSGGTVRADLNFLQNNANYQQSEETSHFTWSVTNSNGTEEFAGLGMSVFNEELQPGVYFFSVSVEDANGCIATSEPIKVLISVPPTFVGTTITPEVCPNSEVELVGVVNQPPEFVMTIQNVNNEETCFDDDHIHEEQYSCFTYNEFEVGQRIESASDILNIGFNMEHSYMGDLEIFLQCPEGNRVHLFEHACGGTYFGEAIDYDGGGRSCHDGPEWVGVGYTYYWSESQPNMGLMSANCGTSGQPLPAGTYAPFQSFESLVGCSINGQWCVIFIDDLGADDGTVFFTEFNFADHIVPLPENVITFQNTYDVSVGSHDINWTTGPNINQEFVTTTTAVPTTPGQVEYVFTATDNFGCTYDTTVSVTVRDFTHPDCCITPTPTIRPVPALNCTNRLNLSIEHLPNGSTGEWTVTAYPNGDDVNNSATFNNPNSPNTQVTVNGWGTYTFRWTEYYLGRDDCTDFTEVTTEFQLQPTNEFTYTPVLCFGDESEIMYVGNAGEDAEFTWGFPGAFAMPNSSPHGPHLLTWQEAGMQTVSLTVNNRGCVTNDTVISILNPERVVIDSISVVNDPCWHSFGGSAVVTHHGGTLPITYSWAAPGTELLNVGAGNYSLVITDANGCTAEMPYIITEPTEMVIQEVMTENLSCYRSQDGEISVLAGGGTGELTYLWSDIGSGDADRIGLTAGEYHLVVTDENLCTDETYITLTQPEPLLIQMTTDYAVCEGEPTPVSVTAMGGTAPYTYWWDRNNGTGVLQGGAGMSELLDTTTRYTVYVEDANLCRSNIQSVMITVSPELVIDSVILNQIKCYGKCDGSAQLAIRGGLSPLVYSWPSENNVYRGICAGQYSVTVTDLIGCSVVTAFAITQKDQFVISSSTDSVTCNGGTDGWARIFVQGATPPYNYIWTNGDRDSLLNDVSAGEYEVTVTDNNGCRYTEWFNVKEPAALLAQPMSNKTICKGQSVDLTTQVTGGIYPYDYRWTGGGANYNGRRFTVSPDEETEYRLTIFDAVGCSLSLDPVIVKVYPDLQITSVVTSYDTICRGEEAIIYVEAIGGQGGPYKLALQDGTIVPSPFSVRPDSTTMYYITMTDECSNMQVTDSIEIFVHSYPDELFTASNVEGCMPLTVTFTPLIIANGTSYFWNFGNNDFKEEEMPSYTYEKAGDYDVTMTVWSEFGCKIERTMEDLIHVYQRPTALFDAELQQISVLSGEVLYNNRSINADRYFWYFGDGDSTTYVHPRHTYPAMGDYETMLVAMNEHFCVDTAIRTVTVYNQFTFYAPTSFTPNGDGLNDCFRICGNGITNNNFLLTIYDRWGALVYKTTRFDVTAECDACSDGSWDGTDWGSKRKGDKLLPNDIYYWYCSFEDVYGILHKKQGTVNMVR